MCACTHSTYCCCCCCCFLLLGVLNHIQVAALFVRLTKLISTKQLRPRDILALPSLLPQVCVLVCRLHVPVASAVHVPLQL